MNFSACDVASNPVNRWRTGRFFRQILLGAVGLLLVLGGTLPAAPAGAEAEIRSAVNRYFEVWSAPDMVAYEACFHPDAVILYRADDGRLVRNMLAPFIESQRLAHAHSKVPMKEIPTRIQILTSAEYASALVHWELTSASGVKRGVDVFSYVKQGKDWKIGSLVFGDEKE